MTYEARGASGGADTSDARASTSVGVARRADATDGTAIVDIRSEVDGRAITVDELVTRSRARRVSALAAVAGGDTESRRAAVSDGTAVEKEGGETGRRSAREGRQKNEVHEPVVNVVAGSAAVRKRRVPGLRRGEEGESVSVGG